MVNRAMISRLMLLALGVLIASAACAQGYKWKSNFDAGNKAMKENRYRVAEDFFRAAAKEAADFDANDTRIGQTLVNLGLALSSQRKFDQADTYLTQAVLFYLKVKGQQSPEAMAVEIQLGDVKVNLGQTDAAEAFYKSALAIAEKLNGEDGDISIDIRLKLANLYLSLRRFDEALDYVTRVKTSLEKKGDNTSAMINCVNIEALVYLDQGKNTEAAALLQQSVALGEKAWGADSANLLWSLGKLGDLSKAAGKFADAEPYFRRILSIRQKSFPKADNTAAILDLAAILQAQRKYAEAEQLVNGVLNTRIQRLGMHHPEVALCAMQLADIFSAQGKLPQAIPIYKQLLADLQKAPGVSPLQIAAAQNGLGLALLKVQDFAAAEPLLREALAAREKAAVGDTPEVADSLAALGLLDLGQEKYEEGEKFFVRAMKIREAAFGVDDPGLIPVLENYAALLVKLDRREEAATLISRVRAIKEKAGIVDPKPAPLEPADL